MRSYDKYRETKFIQKTDVERETLLTIKAVRDENVAPDNQPEKKKYVIHFEERGVSPWVPNIGSLEEIAKIQGTGDVDNWPGTLIVLYVNPDVEFAGKRVGGIRCRAPKNQQPATQASGQNPEYVGDDPAAPPEDGVPF